MKYEGKKAILAIGPKEKQMLEGKKDKKKYDLSTLAGLEPTPPKGIDF